MRRLLLMVFSLLIPLAFSGGYPVMGHFPRSRLSPRHGELVREAIRTHSAIGKMEGP
jgi:hypothetical protein